MESARSSYQRRPFWFSRAIVSGFVATIAMLLVMLITYGLASLLASQPVALADSASRLSMQQSFYGLTHNAVLDLAQNNLYVAIGIHIAMGFVWAILYAVFAEPWLPGPGWQRGLLFSLFPWLLSVTVFLPLVGGGLMGDSMNAGGLPILGNLILHLVYGGVLGLVYGPFGDVVFDEEGAGEVDLRAVATAERNSALGLAGGALAGLIGGGIVALALRAQTTTEIAGTSPGAILIGSILLAGAFGALIGSLMAAPKLSLADR